MLYPSKPYLPFRHNPLVLNPLVFECVNTLSLPHILPLTLSSRNCSLGKLNSGIISASVTKITDKLPFLTHFVILIAPQMITNCQTVIFCLQDYKFSFNIFIPILPHNQRCGKSRHLHCCPITLATVLSWLFLRIPVQTLNYTNSQSLGWMLPHFPPISP